MPIDLTQMTEADLKALSHDIQLKTSNEVQTLNAVLRKVNAELDRRFKALPQADKDATTASLDSVITQLQKP